MAVKAMATITLTRIEFIGRNLLLNSNEVITNKSYPITTYKLSEKMIVGQEYTLCLWGTLGAGKTSFTPYLNGGSVSLGALKNNGDGTFSSTFVGKDSGVTTGDSLHIYPMANAVSVDSTITKIKLEKGDLATDWTEAPEDVEARIGGKADQSNLDAVIGDVDAIKEDLDTKLDENTFIAQQAAYEEWLTRVELSATTAEQLSATLELATLLIDLDLKGQAQRWSTLEGFVQIDATTGTFSIKSNNNGTQMILTDDAMSFLSGGELVATITNQYLQIARGIFTSSAQIGRHKFEPLASDNDHFVLSYVGKN